ncbi:MAG TPA: DUF4345 family protein [Stellaceae bacterium]|nr:DUF4345 family protein [Stellaceae bacterium]
MGYAFGSSVLAITALFCLWTAGISGMKPRAFAARLGLAIANPGGENEVRAQYAGFFLAVGSVCAAALLGLVPRQSALIVLAVVFGGLIAGRLVSLVLNGGVSGYGPAIRALYAIDAAGFAVTLAALIVDKST